MYSTPPVKCQPDYLRWCVRGNAVVFVISVLTVFPEPFGLLIFGPPDVWVIAACFAYIVGPRLRDDASLWMGVKQQIDVLLSSVPHIYLSNVHIGFVSFTGASQMIFIVVLPIVRLIAKNRISRTLKTHDDMKPEAVIFTVEVFHALYISNALQIATSWGLTAVVMVLDLGSSGYQCWIL
ncbi:unnamed protein product [Phytophthora lilii]|uniref:Unnamed protein product n=1 Tax=Phytophthora lilii TaxID=2077276 RepID=A0A9W6WMA3_9STRA|nr:unnamed protein product [Phytophthora lilii]